MRPQGRTRQATFQIPFIPCTKIALIGWCKGQFGSKQDVIRRRNDFRHLRVEERERTSKRQAVNRRGSPGELTLKALDFGIRRIVGEEQVDDRRVENCRLQVFDFDKEGRTVQPERIVEQFGFPAEFIILHFISIEGIGDRISVRAGCAPWAVEQAGPEAFRIGRKEKHVVRWRPFTGDLVDKAVCRGLVRRTHGIARSELRRDVRAERLCVIGLAEIEER